MAVSAIRAVGFVVAACAGVVCAGLLLAATRGPDSASLSAIFSGEPSAASVAEATVRFPIGDEVLMPLYVDMDINFCDEWVGRTVAIAVEYYPVMQSSLKHLWVEGGSLEVRSRASTARVRLYRLRPNQYYNYNVWVNETFSAIIAARGTFRANATGWKRFDQGPYVHVSGGAPSFEMGTFAVYPSYVANDEIKQWFQGLIAVDAEGWVVWKYSLCMIEAWDFLPDNSVVMVARNDGSCTMLTNHDQGVPTLQAKDPTGAIYVANSQLQRVAPDGALASQFIAECSRGPLNFNRLSHECRVDRASANLDVITTMYKADVVPDMEVPLKMGPSETLSEKYDTFANTVLVAWDRSRGELRPLYDLTDFAPVTQAHLFETTAWNTVHMNCAGDSSRTAVEFHHVSSVSVGSDDNYVVASRNLDTIWSLWRDGSGLQWVLSSHDEIGSDFAFERDLDKFYQPHSVLQLENGNLLVIDDGTDRPGCTIERTGACFSRAVMYRLDRDAGAVALVWQFAYPDRVAQKDDFYRTSQVDTWNEVGGSLYRLENGNYLVAFSSVAASDVNPRGAAQIFELDLDGNSTAASYMEVPTPAANVGTQNGYRFVPWRSVAGETSIVPAFVARGA